jgi:myosin heavy subunit
MTEADTPSTNEMTTPKPKREMTDKQKAVLAAARIKAIEVRRENAELRAKEKEVERREKAATLEARRKRVADALGGSASSTSVDVPTLQQEEAVEQPEPTPEQEPASEPEEQDEPEQEAPPAKAKGSKKKKKVVYVTDSSESETASDSEEIQYVRRKKSSSSRRGRSPTRRNDIPAAPQQPMYSADYLRVFGSPY